jgi:hypothetical protein
MSAFGTNFARCWSHCALDKMEFGNLNRARIYISDHFSCTFLLVRRIIRSFAGFSETYFRFQQCQATIDEIWGEIAAQKNPLYNDEVTRDNPSSWDTPNLPRMANLGLVGTFPCCGPQAWSNRQNPQIYDVARTLMRRDDLWINFDRYGFMRPTRQIRFKKEDGIEEFCDKDDWKTVNGWIHWDISPWTFKQSVMGFKNEGDYDSKYENVRGVKGHRLSEEEKEILQMEYGGVRLQGLIALADSREQDGGFCTVPNFAPEFFQWALDNYELYEASFKNSNFVPVPKTDQMRHRVVKVPVRAGSLIFWSNKQPHANYPNNSDQFRYVQYLTPVPANPGRWQRQYPADVLPMKNFVPSELGMKLFGLEAWPRGCVLL